MAMRAGLKVGEANTPSFSSSPLGKVLLYSVLYVSHRTPFNASKGLRACSQEWKDKEEHELSLLFVKISGLHNKF